jgi:hypothetical protein
MAARKRSNVLYQVDGKERASLEQAKLQAVQAVNGFRQLIAFIANREGLTGQVQFDEDRMAFVRDPQVKAPVLSRAARRRLEREERRAAKQP